MKAHKLTFVVVDFENYGSDNYITEIEQADMGGMASCIDVESVDIGEWHDDHPLNFKSKKKDVFEEFSKIQSQR